MTLLAVALLLTGESEAQPVPSPEPPPLVVIHDEFVVPVSRPIRALMPEVTSAPAPLPRATRPARRAQVILRSYFSEDDYPARAARENQEGTVAFRLDVDSAGNVATCTVTGSSGSPALDQATCRILRSRPHFVPARMADGSFAADSVRGRVRWRLPEAHGRAGLPIAAVPARLLTPNPGAVSNHDYPRDAPRLPAGGSGLRVAIGRAGRVIGCEIVGSSGSAILDAAACPLYAARARFAPARNLTGAAICDVTWDTVGWLPHEDRSAPGPNHAARVPGPLRAQLRTRHCPGWSPN
jgi:TonB family protein